MTQRSVTYLKGKFETGDIPTQADYGDFIDSYVNLEASATQTMAGKLVAPALLATKFYLSQASANATGTTQGSAASLSSDMTFLVTTDAERSGVLPSIDSGRVQTITNSGTTSASIFPSPGTNFVGTAANAAILLAVNGTMMVTHVATSAYGVIRTQAV